MSPVDPMSVGETLAQDLALFVDSTADRALFLTDPQGLIRSWNLGAELLTGWTLAEIVGKPASLLYPRVDVDRGYP